MSAVVPSISEASSESPTPEQRIAGCLLGTAVADALGLPYEGLSRRRAQRLLGAPDRFRFLFGRGMCSDDTEHSWIVAQSLIASAGDPLVFQRELAKRLRTWFLLLPAGIGFATLRACCRLCLGRHPDRSGVASAGNGPAMRAALIGTAVSQRERVRRLTRIATRITHTDPLAEQGAQAVALAAWMVAHTNATSVEDWRSLVHRHLESEDDSHFAGLMNEMTESVVSGESTEEFAGRCCRRSDWGVSGYVMETVPVSLHAWLRHRHEFGAAVRAVIRCGGDADTTAAITGGLAGAECGAPGEQFTSRIAEWPAGITWQRELARQLAEVMETGIPDRPAELRWPTRLLRNVFFAAIVLLHGFRRLFPPR